MVGRSQAAAESLGEVRSTDFLSKVGDVRKLQATFRIGALDVSALSDGAPERALGHFFVGADEQDWMRAIGVTHPKDPVPFNFGAFLVRGDDHVVLVDSGYGARMRGSDVPGGGELPERLAELGVAREDVDLIVHTHLHADHCGWDVDDTEGGLMFPNATVHVARAELDYWLRDPSADPDGASNARSRLAPADLAGRIRPADGETAVTPSLSMLPTPGHTPGHCSVMLTSEEQHLLILGDVAHHPVHLEQHDWIPRVDLDPAESQRSRRRMAELAVARDALVTGGHFPILTLGRIRRDPAGFRWERVDGA